MFPVRGGVTVVPARPKSCKVGGHDLVEPRHLVLFHPDKKLVLQKGAVLLLRSGFKPRGRPDHPKTIAPLRESLKVRRYELRPLLVDRFLLPISERIFRPAPSCASWRRCGSCAR